MNKVATILLAALFLACTQLNAQLFLTLKKMPAENVWGVYVQPCDTLSPTNQTITGSGQVTIVAKMGSAFSEITNVAGAWDDNALVASPDENPGMLYFTLGFVADLPAIVYTPGEETLLFTFKLTSPDGSPPALIDNETDPFAQLPNSAGTNPGNDLSVVDFGKSPLQFYNFSGLYQDGQPVECGEETTTTATSEAQSSGFFRLYPNPTSKRLILKPENTTLQNAKAQLWNANMVQLGTLKLSGNNKAEMDIENLPAGTYLITIETDGQVVQTERFLKVFD
jgi:hypothetical protein